MSETPPTLDYDEPPPERWRAGPSQYLADFIASALLVGVFAAVLSFTRRLSVAFEEFGLELPAATRVLVAASAMFHSFYGWIAIWLVPFLVPFLLARLGRETRRRVLRLAILLLGLFIAFVIVALYVPLLRLIEGIPDGPARAGRDHNRFTIR